MNLSLISASFKVTEGETKMKKYAAELAEEWNQRYPNRPFTGKHLLAQIRNIKTRKLLAPDEIDGLRNEAVIRSPTSRLTNIRRSIRESLSAPRLELRSLVEEMGVPDDELTHGILAIFEETSIKWTGIPIDKRPRINRIKLNPDAKKTMEAIDKALKRMIVNSEELEELCHKVYCAAMVANFILQAPVTQRNNRDKNQKPLWEKRLETKIAAYRREIGIIHVALNQQVSRKVNKKLKIYMQKINLKVSDHQYKLKLHTHAEKLKQRIAALGNRLRRYHKRTLRYQQNNLFTNNQKIYF